MRQPEGREVVIVEAVRTPIGRGHKEKGYYKDTHPNALLGKCLHRGDRARRHRRRPRSRTSIAGCVQQFGEQGFNIARNAWLQEGLPIETPGHHRRPPVRLRPAGRQLLRRADRRRRARRDDRLGRRAHGPPAVRRRHEDAGGLRLRVHARADGQAQHRRPGPRRRDDRRPVGDLPLRARRAGGALAPARPPGDRGGPLRARDRADVGQRRHVRDRPGHPARTRASRRSRS